MNVLWMFLWICSNFWLAGATAQTNQKQTTLEMLAARRAENQRLRDASPETKVWLENRNGETIREVGISCTSAMPGKSYSRSSKWRITVADKPELVWTEKYPDPIVLETLTVEFDKSGRRDFALQHRCPPGAALLVVIEENGAVTVKAKE